MDQQRDDEWIIENLKYHFNEKIQEKFELREPRTITEAADILMKFDKADYGITSRRKFNKGSNFSRNTTQFGNQRSNETGTKKQSFNYQDSPEKTRWGRKKDKKLRNMEEENTSSEEEKESEIGDDTLQAK